MRSTSLAALAVIVALSTCTPSDSGRVAAPRIAAAHEGDFTGAPDLIVDGKALEGSWVVYDQILKEGTCTLEEGGVLELYTFAKPRHASEVPELMFKVPTISNPWVHLQADMSDPEVSELMLPQHFT